MSKYTWYADGLNTDEIISLAKDLIAIDMNYIASKEKWAEWNCFLGEPAYASYEQYLIHAIDNINEKISETRAYILDILIAKQG